MRYLKASELALMLFPDYNVRRRRHSCQYTDRRPYDFSTGTGGQDRNHNDCQNYNNIT